MSYTEFGVNDSLAVKLWSKNVAAAERDTSDVGKLMGESDNAIIQEKTEFSKSAGDKVTFSLRARLSGKGFGRNDTAQGNAEAMTFFDEYLLIDELGHTVGMRSKNTIDAQRVPFDLREQGKDGLADWWKDRKSVSWFNHACGFTPANAESLTTGLFFTGLNTVVAPSSDRIIRAGTATTDQALTSADTFTVSLIDKAKELAGLGNNIVRPTMINGSPMYVMYIDPSQVTQLRTNTSAGQWQDIQKAAISGGQITKNPIFTGAYH